MASQQLVVGFDLDMTLVDSRKGVAAAWDAVAAETGVFVDSALAVSRLGPPVEDEAANWFPPQRVPAVAARYRELARELQPYGVTLMPGAVEAFEAVRRQRGRVLVVTAKQQESAVAVLEAVGLEPDEIIGDVWAEAKGTALRAHGASIYVGDHLGDVRGAAAAGAVSVGVATGPIAAADLRAAGAEVTLTDLREFPGWLDEHLLTTRLASLQAELAGLGSLLVAFSGGADSAFLLAAAVRALGPDRVVAGTAVSPSLPPTELAAAREFAASLGVRHVTPGTDEMAREGYRANAGDRCYFCKAELLDVMGPVARDLGVDHLATGTNADDAVAGFRPGIRAAAERGAVTPLLDAGLTKAQVRTASRRWGLVTWDKPAAACLSSRVAYGISITPARLARVDRAEQAVRASLHEAGLPVENLRVRDLGETARLEVDAELVERVQAMGAVYDAVRAEGFSAVEVDPQGFRSGSMNEMLAEPSQSGAR